MSDDEPKHREPNPGLPPETDVVALPDVPADVAASKLPAPLHIPNDAIEDRAASSLPGPLRILNDAIEERAVTSLPPRPPAPPAAPSPTLDKLIEAGRPGFLDRLGARAMQVAQEVGGIVVLLAQVVRALLPPRIDFRELFKNLYKMGNRSVPIVVLTAFFAGGLMTLQTGPFVKKFGATGLAGWGAGYAVLREMGPILIALMFSGRVGANNTAELATMTVTEQLDGLRALAIDPVRFLVVPRVVAMMVMLVALTVIGDLVALTGASIVGHFMLDIEWATMYHSFADNLKPYDFLHGIYKSIAFGGAIAMSSCYFGVTVRGGAVGVGRAVNAAVVAAAVSIMLLDFFLTYLTG